MRIGIFGGSFDPVHNGHIALASACRDQAVLDEIWCVPAARQPFKPNGPKASDEDRCAMLHLAIAAAPRMIVSRIEIDRPGISYTIDTLRKLSNALPATSLFLLLGADSLGDLSQWREAREICRLATPLVVARRGSRIDFGGIQRLVTPARLAAIKQMRVDMTPVDVSSTKIRQLLAEGKSIAQFVHPDVARWIGKKGLYTAK